MNNIKARYPEHAISPGAKSSGNRAAPLATRHTRLSRAIITLGGLLLVQAPHAQERVLEEILVTAQKRTESLQDVPVAVTAVSAAELENLNITQMEDLTRASASLTYTQAGNKQSSSFRIRGIGTNVFSIGAEPAVAVVIDDVSQVQQGQALSNLVDVERVEVLRGPQSTLYGKNASAGLISVVTKAPSLENEAFIEASYTDDEELRLSGSVSGHVTDDFGYRVSAFYSDFDGHSTNLFTGDDTNAKETKGARARFEWALGDTFSLGLIAWYSEDDDSCCSLTHRFVEPGAAYLNSIPFEEMNPRTKPSDKNKDPEIDTEPEAETDDTGVSLRANLDIGEHTLLSITSWNNWEYDDASDSDWSAYPVAAFFTNGAVPGGVTQFSSVDTELFTQEFRLVSPDWESFDYLVGLYYADADTDRDFMRTPPFIASWDANSTTESFAVFGQFNWRFSQKNELTVGARYNDEDISATFNDRPSSNTYKGSDGDDEWLGKVSLQHYLDDDTMLFASVTTGYKGKVYDISSGFDQDTADNPVDPESSTSYELGVKTTLMENRLQLNAVAFYTEYDDYQAQNAELEGTDIVLGITNVGKLETSGVELDAVALIGERLTLSTSAAYVDATIDEFPGANCYSNLQTEAQGCVPVVPGSSTRVQDLSGEPLNNSPDWKVNFSAQYDQPLPSLPFDAFFQANYHWQDEVNFDLLGHPNAVQDSYGITNVNLGIFERTNEKYRVTLFVNNLFDEDYATSIGTLDGLYGDKDVRIHYLPRNAERYAGLRVRYSF
jgi:iron complex outermembrane receptor protein